MLNKTKRKQKQQQHAQPFTRAVAAMDSCFGLVRPHQHHIAVGQRLYHDVLDAELAEWAPPSKSQTYEVYALQ